MYFLWLFYNFKTEVNLFIKKTDQLNGLSIKENEPRGVKTMLPMEREGHFAHRCAPLVRTSKIVNLFQTWTKGEKRNGVKYLFMS